SFMAILHAQGDQGRGGGYLFGNAPAGALPVCLVAEQRHLALDEEGPAVRLALNRYHLVTRQLTGTRLQEFLQPGFRILVGVDQRQDRKSTRLNSSHVKISY